MVVLEELGFDDYGNYTTLYNKEFIENNRKYLLKELTEELKKVWFLCWVSCYDERQQDPEQFENRCQVFLKYKSIKFPNARNYIISCFFMAMRNQEQIFNDIILKKLKRECRTFDKKNNFNYDPYKYDRWDDAYNYDSSDSENFDSDYDD